jgi:hypothetical protein
MNATKKGLISVPVASRQIEDRDGALYAVITVTDISEQKHAENVLREANLMLEERRREIEADLQLAANVQQGLAPESIQWGKTGVETDVRSCRCIDNSDCSRRNERDPVGSYLAADDASPRRRDVLDSACARIH